MSISRASVTTKEPFQSAPLSLASIYYINPRHRQQCRNCIFPIERFAKTQARCHRTHHRNKRIKDGDLALVHKQNTLNDGELGVIVYGDNEGTLKRFVKKGNMIILQPFNPEYEAKIITGEELNDVYIAGKVVETKTKW